MNRTARLFTCLLASLSASGAIAADRTIAVSPAVQESWEFATHTTTGRLRPQLGVGFWQRASGAKPGVGSNYVSALEYQLPEAAPGRVRSASFQFSGRPSQCVGAEPVVIDVYAYAADGKVDVSDAAAGSRVAQLTANCSDNPAFTRPIDVTAIVRQQSVPAGIRHVGFNIRKANNRQGPGLFNLAAGKLTIVLADQEIAKQPGAKPAVATAPTPAPVTATAAATATATAKAPAPAVAPNAQARAIVAQSRTGVGNAPARPASSAAALRNATRQAVPK